MLNVCIFECLVNIQQRLSLLSLNSAKPIYRIAGKTILVFMCNDLPKRQGWAVVALPVGKLMCAGANYYRQPGDDRGNLPAGTHMHFKKISKKIRSGV